MIKNADGWTVENTFIDKVSVEDDWYWITGGHGWTTGVSKEECGNLVPAIGDSLTVYTKGFSEVVGLEIAGHQVRYKTPSQVERERIDWLINYRQEKLDRLRNNWDNWQERVEKLHPVLKKRIRRFESQGESNNSKFEFWLEDGGYELMALEGANALINWATGPGRFGHETPEAAVKYWWSLNTAEHDYNYQAQKDLVPEFGEGHSGNTAGAAYSLALGILTGSYSE